jgi:hypothetical protein
VTELPGTLAPGETLQLTIAIPAFGTIEGDLFFGDGSAATGGGVELLEPGVTRPPQTATATGFRFTTVRAAVELTVRARHPVPGREHIYKEENVTIPREGATLDVPVQLPATGTVTVAVERQDDGTGIPGVEVFLQDSFSGSFRAEGATDANGERIVSVVPGGAFTVRAERDGQLLGEAGDSIEQHGDEVTVAFTVSGDASVSGIVLAGDGETPVPGARVELRSEDGSLLLSETESALDGSYRFDDAVEPATSALVRAFLPGAPEKSDERVVNANAAGDPAVFDALLPSSVIKGRVLEADGATLVSGATVETTPDGALYPTASLSSETGDFALFDLELGVHTLAAIVSLGVSSYATGTLVSVTGARPRPRTSGGGNGRSERLRRERHSPREPAGDAAERVAALAAIRVPRRERHLPLRARGSRRFHRHLRRDRFLHQALGLGFRPDHRPRKERRGLDCPARVHEPVRGARRGRSSLDASR